MLRAQIEGIAYLDRRHFESRFRRIVRALPIAGPEGPRHGELLYVIGRYLLQWRKALAELIAGVCTPVLVRLPVGVEFFLAGVEGSDVPPDVAVVGQQCR